MIFSGCKIRCQFYSVDLSILYLIFLQKPCRNYCQDGKQVFLETGDTEGALQLRDHTRVIPVATCVVHAPQCALSEPHQRDAVTTAHSKWHSVKGH